MAAGEAPEAIFKHESVLLMTDIDRDQPEWRIDGGWVGIASCDEVYILLC